MNEQNNRFYRSINQLITAVFTLLFISLPLIYSNQVIETASLPRHILIASVASILLILLSIQYVSTKKTHLTFSKTHLALFLFYCWALLSLTWSIDPKNTVIELTQLTAFFIIIFSASQLNTHNHIKQIMLAIYIGAAIAAIIGILQVFNFNPLGLQTTTPLASTFNNKNHASVYFDLVIPLSLIAMLTTKSYSKYISSLAYTLGITFILLSKTKGSLLGFVVFTLLFFALIYKNNILRQQLFNRKKVIQYIALTLILPSFLYTLTNISFIDSTTTPEKWNSNLTDKSASIRLSWYKNAYTMFKEQPILGVGYGAFRKGFTPYASSPHAVTSVTEERSVAQLHNDPYQNLLELGIIGAGVIIFIFSYLLFKSTSVLLNTEIKSNNEKQLFLLACFLALIASITHSFVDFPMRLPSSAVLFWFITGLTLSLLNKELKYSCLKNKFYRSLTGVLTVIFITLFSIHSADLYQRFFSASKLQLDATVLMIKSKDNCTINAKEKMDQAINLFFESHSIRHRYSQIYSFCDLPAKDKLFAMNRVLNYDSTHNRARLTRAQIHLDKRELKLAQADFDYLIAALPLRPAAYLGQGDIATLKKDYITARKYYEKAKILEPKNKKALFMLKQFNEKGV